MWVANERCNRAGHGGRRGGRRVGRRGSEGSGLAAGVLLRAVRGAAADVGAFMHSADRGVVGGCAAGAHAAGLDRFCLEQEQEEELQRVHFFCCRSALYPIPGSAAAELRKDRTRCTTRLPESAHWQRELESNEGEVDAFLFLKHK